MIEVCGNIGKNVIRRVERYIELARALKPSNQTGQMFHVTIACRKRKIIAIGINNYRKLHNAERWGHYHPCKSLNTSLYRPGIHSEISALIKLGLEDCKDLDFFNIRIGNNGEVMVSRPCENCYRVLNQVGYRHCYFFNENGKLCRFTDPDINFYPSRLKELAKLTAIANQNEYTIEL